METIKLFTWVEYRFFPSNYFYEYINLGTCFKFKLFFNWKFCNNLTAAPSAKIELYAATTAAANVDFKYHAIAAAEVVSGHPVTSATAVVHLHPATASAAEVVIRLITRAATGVYLRPATAATAEVVMRPANIAEAVVKLHPVDTAAAPTAGFLPSARPTSRTAAIPVRGRTETSAAARKK